MKSWHPEEIRKLTAQADYTAMQTARLRGELVPVAAVESYFSRALMSFRQHLEDSIDHDDEEERARLERILRLLNRAFAEAMAGILTPTPEADPDCGEPAHPKARAKRLAMGRSQSDSSPRNQRKKPKGVTEVLV